MKKNLIIIFSILFLGVLLSACKNNDGKQSNETNQKIEKEDSNENNNTIADAALYRGILKKIEEKEDTKYIYVEQFDGRDYGNLYMTFKIDKENDAKIRDLKEGDYLEVYYGISEDNNNQEEPTAISIKNLLDVSLLVYNGSIEKIDREKKFIMLKTFGESETEIIINYGDETQFYLEFDSLKEGDMINVLTNGIQTRSIPPQTLGLEITPYFSIQS